ncbi:hypothetical protein SAMN05421852_101260 [Thermoflavimicrobium dichotomicum]|uniref:Uncharacterized protein n=1 Tax=Thermoflavimicrobium dichotomicum TaxID=46223 RepID=A0A1I3JZB9_9BACL|nr:hypothetical protein SAMN05421852_101260 [Thermoflavimicrobium dichotomicum]
MNYTVVGKDFWIGIINAVLLSIPLWFLFYLFLCLIF